MIYRLFYLSYEKAGFKIIEEKEEILMLKENN